MTDTDYQSNYVCITYKMLAILINIVFTKDISTINIHKERQTYNNTFTKGYKSFIFGGSGVQGDEFEQGFMGCGPVK